MRWALLALALLAACSAQASPAGRELLGTLTIGASQGTAWAGKVQIQTGKQASVDESGATKRSAGVATAGAFASNGACCLTGCTKPEVSVSTNVDGGNAGAEAYAAGSKLSAAGTKVRGVDTAENEGTVAVASGEADSSSVQTGGNAAAATSAVQTNAVALPGGSGSFTATADAAANEANGGRSRTNARINGRVFNLPAWFPRTREP